MSEPSREDKKVQETNEADSSALNRPKDGFRRLARNLLSHRTSAVMVLSTRESIIEPAPEAGLAEDEQDPSSAWE